MIDRNQSCVSTCIHFLPFSQYSLEISATPYAPDDLCVKTDLLLLIYFFISFSLFFCRGGVGDSTCSSIAQGLAATFEAFFIFPVNS